MALSSPVVWSAIIWTNNIELSNSSNYNGTTTSSEKVTMTTPLIEISVIFADIGFYNYAQFLTLVGF